MKLLIALLVHTTVITVGIGVVVVGVVVVVSVVVVVGVVVVAGVVVVE